MLIGILVIASIIFTITPGVFAHPLSASFGDLKIDDKNATLVFSIDDLSVIESVSADQDNNGKLSQEEVNSSSTQIVEWMTRNLSIKFNGQVQRPEVGDLFVETRSDKQVVTASFRYNISESTETLAIDDQFYFNSSDKTSYTHFLTVNHNGLISEHLIKGEDRILEISMTDGVSQSSGSWFSFLIFGMEHILTGYDHLLFLFALLLAKQSFREYVKIVTAFTIAHSITITLGYLEIVTLNSKFVESVIALSICYVAIENIFRKEIKYRTLITFIFGLIHGLGFAGLLSEMTIPKSHLVTSLLSFNLGIEIVQVAIVAVVIPILHYLQKLKGYTRAVQYSSALIVLIGAFWVVERVLG